MKRRLSSLTGNSQCLDGGSMFGNAPKVLWERWISADERNRIPLAGRAMLIQEEGRLILFDTGIGAFFDPKRRDRFGVEEDRHVLLDELDGAGFSDEEIDVVVLSHLHFDHAGGLLDVWHKGEPLRLRFPNARFVVGEGAWKRARKPHLRERTSFIAELPSLMESSGRLEVMRGQQSATLGPDYRFHLSDGHTPGLIMVEISSREGPILFASDLIPGVPWIHLPITTGYDRFPELLVEEKDCILSDLVRWGGRIFFFHDPNTALARVTRNKRGRFGVVETISDVKNLEI